MKVTIYGQVNKAFRLSSSDGETTTQVVDNDASSSRLGILAGGAINPNLSIGALHELEWQENRRSGTKASNDGANSRLRSRHVDLWLTHKDLGTLSLGKGSIAGGLAHFFSLSGIGNAFHFGQPNGHDATAGPAYTFGGFFGARQNRIRYDTPSLMGLSLAASLNENQGWSLQAHYSGAPPGIKNFNTLMRAG